MLRTLERWRKRPADEKSRIVSTITLTVMIIITALWLPLFFYNVRLGFEPQQEERIPPQSETITPPYAE